MKLRPEDLEAFPAEDLDLIQGHLDGELSPRQAGRARKLLADRPAYRKLLDLLRGLDVLSKWSVPVRHATFAWDSYSRASRVPGLQEAMQSRWLAQPDVPAPPADWRARAARLDPPLRQVPMRVAPEHAELLDQPFELACDEHVFDESELDILDEYGALLKALATREVRPRTKDEQRFYATCVSDASPSSDEERVWTKYQRQARDRFG